MSIRHAFLICCFLCGLPAHVLAEDITPEKKAELETSALAGSPSAAREVALYHGTGNDKLFEFWSWIGAENGDPICQYNYASILLGRADAYSKARAQYWMKLAAEKKVKFAEEALKKMKKEAGR